MGLDGGLAFTKPGEAKLIEWIATTLVRWVETACSWCIDMAVFENRCLRLPFNIDGNPDWKLAAALKVLRARVMARAKQRAASSTVQFARSASRKLH